MPRLLIVDSNPRPQNRIVNQHAGVETGEGYARVLKALQADLQITIVRPYDGEAHPSLADIDGMVFTGSGVEWCVDDERARPIADLIESGFKSGLPVFGSCNGMQLAAVLLGGACRAAPSGREDGLARNIELTRAGLTHPMMQGRSKSFSALCVHRDEVASLPDEAEILAGNHHSAIQAFVYEQGGVNFWGCQYHPEFSPAFLSSYLFALDRVTADYARDLADIDTNPDAAERLGINQTPLNFDTRTLELRNWLKQL